MSHSQTLQQCHPSYTAAAGGGKGENNTLVHAILTTCTMLCLQVVCLIMLVNSMADSKRVYRELDKGVQWPHLEHMNESALKDVQRRARDAEGPKDTILTLFRPHIATELLLQDWLGSGTTVRTFSKALAMMASFHFEQHANCSFECHDQMAPFCQESLEYLQGFLAPGTLVIPSSPIMLFGGLSTGIHSMEGLLITSLHYMNNQPLHNASHNLSYEQLVSWRETSHDFLLCIHDLIRHAHDLNHAWPLVPSAFKHLLYQASISDDREHVFVVNEWFRYEERQLKAIMAEWNNRAAVVEEMLDHDIAASREMPTKLQTALTEWMASPAWLGSLDDFKNILAMAVMCQEQVQGTLVYCFSQLFQQSTLYIFQDCLTAAGSAAISRERAWLYTEWQYLSDRVSRMTSRSHDAHIAIEVAHEVMWPTRLRIPVPEISDLFNMMFADPIAFVAAYPPLGEDPSSKCKKFKKFLLGQVFTIRKSCSAFCRERSQPGAWTQRVCDVIYPVKVRT